MTDDKDQMWAAVQKGLYATGLLSEDEVRAMEALPDWTWEMTEDEVQWVRDFGRILSQLPLPESESCNVVSFLSV